VILRRRHSRGTSVAPVAAITIDQRRERGRRDG
jgi:hypothetical protein